MLEKEKLITYDDIIEQCAEAGISVTWRKLNYYKSLGLLPKSQRVEKDKRGYYPSYITQFIFIYYFLQNNLSFTLEEIRGLIKRFKLPPVSGEQYFFGSWVTLTYSYFFKFAQNTITTFFEHDTITATISINHAYKAQFQKTGVSRLYEVSREKEGNVGSFRVIAEAWGKEAAELIREVKEFDWYSKLKK